MDVLHLNQKSLQLKHPFRMLISGPSGVGKSRFVLDQIISRNDSIDQPIKRIFYYYGTFDSMYHAELSSTAKAIYNIDIIFEKGIGNVDPDELDPSSSTLLIFDDLFMEIQQSQTLATYFTRETRHKNTSVIMIQQTIFGRGKFSREISLNCNYFICFKNLIDQEQFAILARRIEPRRANFLQNCLQLATKDNNHGHLLMDLVPDSNDLIRYRQGVGRKTVAIYIPKQTDINSVTVSAEPYISSSIDD